MVSGDVDATLHEYASDKDFRHPDAVRYALRFRSRHRVADLVAVVDDPHPCQTVEVVFALAVAKHPWLNWVPMPTESCCASANQVGKQRAAGADVRVTSLIASTGEPPSAVVASGRVLGTAELKVLTFPPPDIRVPLRRGRFDVWRYDGTKPVPSVAAPSAEAIAMLHAVGDETWASPLSGYAKAAPLGELSLDDLLGLLAHLPGPPDNLRWQAMASVTPTYWYRLMQPWVCLGILRHAEHEPWIASVRREVLIDLAFGVEDWVADSALFALVTAAYRDPDVRAEVRGLVRQRLDVALVANRLVTIGESLARLSWSRRAASGATGPRPGRC
ncbi:MAG TPA: hypothetical protein VGJ28_02160 [Micromonosporaceae bacterium]